MRKLVLLLGFVVFWLQGAVGQSVSTMGNDFWMTFMDNQDANETNNRIRVFVSSEHNCSVTLTNPNVGWSTSATVSPGQVTNIEIPIEMGRNQVSGMVNSTGIHLTATNMVSVYAATTGTWNYDVANVLPTNTLRDEYMVLCYPADRYSAEFAVVATQNNTTVDIILSTPVVGHAAGDTITVNLPNAGKAYFLQSLAPGDFSGTRVKARDCKKIAVFHGDACLYVPDRWQGQSCDHVVEQAIPIQYWGRRFLVVPSLAALADRIRITSLVDNCVVTRNGVQMGTPFDAGETREYTLSNVNQPDYVVSSDPISINVYFASTGSGMGDPSMLTLNPLEQVVNNITFSSYTTPYTSAHRVNIITKTQYISQILVDGATITNSFILAQNNPEYSYARLVVSAGSHTISAPDGCGFNAYAYGLGSHESYAYSVGSSMVDLSNQLFVEGDYSNINNIYDACVGEQVHMSVETQETPTYIVWNFGDGGVGVNNTVVHQYQDTGLFEVTARIGFSIMSCFSSHDTLRTFIRVWPADTTELYEQSCDTVYNWFGSPLAQEGIYTYHLENRYGCDSLLVLHLSFVEPTSGYSYKEGCDSVSVGGQLYYTDDTVRVGTLQNAAGCDSILYVILSVFPSYESTQEYNLMGGDTLVWIDGNIYTASATSTTVLPTVHGCDSVIHLSLVVSELPPPPHVDSVVVVVDSSAIWAPNAFTPELETNTEFRVFSNDVLSLQVHIFTRWGLHVTSFDGLTESWDGTFKGVPCKSEAYVYLLEYTTKTRPNYIQKKSGTVLLIR